MYAQVGTSKENSLPTNRQESRSVAYSVGYENSNGKKGLLGVVDNRIEATAQRNQQSIIDKASIVKSIQKKENSMEQNDNLKSGKETHLAHDAWHVVQHKQGRMKPTLQIKGGVDINDDDRLHKETDCMRRNALQLRRSAKSSSEIPIYEQHLNHTAQRKFELDYSKISPENSLQVKEIVSNALKYIMSSGIGKIVWDELDRLDKTIQIQVRADDFAPTTFSAFGLFGADEDEEGIKEFLSAKENLFVRWNVLDLNKLNSDNPNHHIPKSGVETQSVANALVHELGHARQILNPGTKAQTLKWYRGQREALKGKNGGLGKLYNQLIELDNLLRHEIPFSMEMGEPVRSEYACDGKLLNLLEALNDAKTRIKCKEPSVSPIESQEIFGKIEKGIVALKRKVLDAKLSSRDYSIPSDVDMDKVEKELQELEDELFSVEEHDLSDDL